MLAIFNDYRNIYLIFINRTGPYQEITELITPPIFYSQFFKPLPQYLCIEKRKNSLDFPYKICYHICRYKISSEMLFSKYQLNCQTHVNVTLSDSFSKQRTGKNVHEPLQPQGLSR